MKMQVMFAVLAVSISVITLPTVLQAQISECDGKWINGPCSGSVTKEIAEAPPSEQTMEKSDRSRREQWLHELNMLSLEAKRRYGVVPVMGPIQDLCRSEDSTLDDCREAITKREQELQTLMAEYAKADAAKAAAASERDRKGESAVTVVNQPPPVVYVVPRRRHVETYSTGGASVSITASGNIKGSDVSAGVSLGSGTTTNIAPQGYPPKQGALGGSFGSSAQPQGGSFPRGASSTAGSGSATHPPLPVR